MFSKLLVSAKNAYVAEVRSRAETHTLRAFCAPPIVASVFKNLNHKGHRAFSQRSQRDPNHQHYFTARSRVRKFFFEAGISASVCFTFW